MDPEDAQSVRGQTDTREEVLVAGLRSGDEAAFGELFDRYYSPMLSVARHYVATR